MAHSWMFYLWVMLFSIAKFLDGSKMNSMCKCRPNAGDVSLLQLMIIPYVSPHRRLWTCFFLAIKSQNFCWSLMPKSCVFLFNYYTSIACLLRICQSRGCFNANLIAVPVFNQHCSAVLGEPLHILLQQQLEVSQNGVPINYPKIGWFIDVYIGKSHSNEYVDLFSG